MRRTELNLDHVQSLPEEFISYEAKLTYVALAELNEEQANEGRVWTRRSENYLRVKFDDLAGRIGMSSEDARTFVIELIGHNLVINRYESRTGPGLLLELPDLVGSNGHGR